MRMAYVIADGDKWTVHGMNKEKTKEKKGFEANSVPDAEVAG